MNTYTIRCRLDLHVQASQHVFASMNIQCYFFKIIYLLADEDVPVFYDAVEDVEELSSDEEAASKSSTDPRIITLRTKLTTITRKRAKIRNGKVNNEAIVE